MIASPGIDSIEKTLELFLEPGEVCELRIPRTRKGTVSGYFSDISSMAKVAAQFDGRAEGVYFTLNPVRKELLARAVNRVVEYAERTTRDEEILKRSWLLVDFDPVRVAGISSTKEEHVAAIGRARQCRSWLMSQGLPLPILADSGNGAHLLISIDLPNDDAACGLVQRFLRALAFKFSDGKVVVDTATYNAGRICKLYGTLSRKGDNTRLRPHRRSSLLDIPDKVRVVNPKLLEKVAALVPTTSGNKNGRKRPNFDLRAWIEQHGLKVAAGGQWNGGQKFILETCPWNPDHKNRAAYVVQLASGGVAAGCHHNGCRGKTWRDLRNLLEPGWSNAAQAAQGEGDSERPVITLRSGEGPDAVDTAEKVLVTHAERLRVFQRGSEIVRVITLPETGNYGGLKRPRGTVQLAPLGTVALTETWDRLIAWQKLRNKSDELPPVRVDCPDKIAAAYLSRLGSWHLPVLTGTVSAPIMRRDGVVLCHAEYDAETQLFLTEDWAELNGSPSRADALRALDILLAPYAEFPFVAPEDRAVLGAAILTALQRRLLLTAPLFGFTAPTQRTGKSLLAECIAILVTGRPAPAMAVSGDREEMRKAVTAALREGHAIINLDNIEQPAGSPDLSRAITQIEYQDRILGASKTLRLPTNLTWTATGNNLAFRGDLAVRALLCRQDAKMERPEERRFKISDLKAYIADHRSDFVSAALTILRAYVVAGRPEQKLKPCGGFDEWSAVIRAPLLWLGMKDPCDTRRHVIEDDPDREAAAALLHAWHSTVGDRSVTIAQLRKWSSEHAALYCGMLSVASLDEGSGIDPRRVAWWCRAWRGRVVDGLVLVRGKDYGKSATWRVAEAADSGISGVNGIKNPSKNSQRDCSAYVNAKECRYDAKNREEHNPTNPTNPKMDERGGSRKHQK